VLFLNQLLNFYSFNLLTEVSKESIEDLYSRIKAKHTQNKSSVPDIDVQHPSLYPKLRSYQIEAVSDA